MENKIFYRREGATYHREKFKKPLNITIILILIFIAGTFNATLLPFAIFGIMGSVSALVILSLLYFNRPSKQHDKQEYVYIQFKANSLKLSLRKDNVLIGDMRKYLIEEVKHPKITYQIFEIPYNKVTAIKEHMSNKYDTRPNYAIYYESNTAIMKPCIIIPKQDFDEALREWFAKLGKS